MRKSAPAAFLLSSVLVFGVVLLASPAKAEDEKGETSSTELSLTPKTGVDEVHVNKHPKHVELEQKYGKGGRLSLPPLVIRPMRDTDDQALISSATVGDARAGFVAINPAARDLKTQLKNGTLIDPTQNTAIDISKVRITKRTPSDVFIQAAQVGLFAMAAGAVLLSVLAVSRAIRRK